MRYVGFVCGFLFSCELQASHVFCAQKFQDLNFSSTLRPLSSLLPEQGVKGFVNGTRGSYFFIRSDGGKFSMTFLTTGLFDLYGVRRDGVIQFCEKQGKIYILGFGYEEEIVVRGPVIQWGGGTPRQTFQEGDVPPLLIEKHDLSEFALK